MKRLISPTYNEIQIVLVGTHICTFICILYSVNEVGQTTDFDRAKWEEGISLIDDYISRRLASYLVLNWPISPLSNNLNPHFIDVLLWVLCWV